MSGWSPASALRWLFDPEHGASGRLIPRWIFLRVLGLIFYSAFFSLLPQIRGLIGPQGILPAGEYLQALAERFGHTAYWYAPTVLWFSGRAHAHRNLLGGHDRFGAAGFEFLAAGHAGDLFGVFSLVRERGAGFFRISIRRNAAGGWIHFPVFRTGGIPAGLGRRKQTVASELVSTGVGMLPDLF